MNLNLIVFAVIPQTPTISSAPSGAVDSDGAYTLTCGTASIGLTSTSYVWSIANVDQSASSSNTLIVNPEDIDRDYKCKVSGDGGKTYSAYSSIQTPTGL